MSAIQSTLVGGLKVESLFAGYGHIGVLEDISLEVEPGELVGILGSNGAGKTTLARAITGLCNVTDGRVSIGDRSIQGARPYRITRNGVGHMPEGRRIFGNLTVAQNLNLALSWQHLSRVKRWRRLEEIFSWFPRLSERKSQRSGTLSGGEQQMLAIARALLVRPKVLILDEPSSGLAPIIVEQMFSIIRQLGQELNISMLIIEQNATKTLEIASRGYVLQRGRIVITGLSDELLSNEDVRATYLGQ